MTDTLPMGTNPLPSPVHIRPPVQPTGGYNKEQEPQRSTDTFLPEEIGIIDRGTEINLPKEVIQIGVTPVNQPVQVPPVLASHGVSPAGNNVTLGTGASVVLPLTDDQIITGMHAGTNNSIRWLAEWCMRKLKKLHIAVKAVHGRIVRSTA